MRRNSGLNSKVIRNRVLLVSLLSCATAAWSADGLFQATGANGEKYLQGMIGADTVVKLTVQAIDANGQALPASALASLQVTIESTNQSAVLSLSGSTLQVNGTVAGPDAFPCTPEKVAGQSSLLRAVVGMSRSARNTGVYCRTNDWVAICSSAVSRSILYESTSGAKQVMRMIATGSPIKIRLVPSYYKNNRYGRTDMRGGPATHVFYKPWEYQLPSKVPCGWISWKAYGAGVNESQIKGLTDWAATNVRDYGFDYVVIDDGWFYGSSRGQMVSVPGNADWTKANSEGFPGGIKSLMDYVHGKGLKIGLWMSPFGFSGDNTANPTWWIRKSANGAILENGWHGRNYIDGSVPEACAGWLTKGIVAQVANGMDYLKVDGMMHVAYEGYSQTGDYFTAKSTTWQTALRQAYAAIRTEVKNQYFSACWSRVPEMAGYADAMRVGGDKSAGYDNHKAQAQDIYHWQYENNIVWCVDPDHMVMAGSGDAEYRLVSTGVSLSGSFFMYSDGYNEYSASKVAIMRRVMPIPEPAPRPGDLYEKQGDPASLWTLEINRPFDYWMVVANTDFNSTKVTALNFKDLGLDSTKSYTVYDFWNQKYMGVFKTSYECGAPGAKDVQVFALREVKDRPFIISTNRHISQGGVDLVNVAWNAQTKTLSGASKVVSGDPYIITLYLPTGATVQSAKFGTTAATIGANNGAATIEYTPSANDTVEWSALFNGAFTGVSQGKRPIKLTSAKLAIVRDNGFVRLRGNYSGAFTIDITDPSGRIIKRLCGTGNLDRIVRIPHTGALVLREKCAERVTTRRLPAY